MSRSSVALAPSLVGMPSAAPFPARVRLLAVSATATDDHGTQPAHAERVLRRLETIHDLTVHGDTTHMQHLDPAKRARQLAQHLRAVLLLSEARHYPSALVVVRSALEHRLMDRLIFLATRRIVVYTGVKKKDAPTLSVRLRAAQATDQPDIARGSATARA